MRGIGRFFSTNIGRRLVVYSLCFWVPLVIFVQLADEVREQEPLPGDATVVHWLQGLHAPWLDSLAMLITESASTIAVVCVVVALTYVLLRARRYRDAVFIAVVSGGTVAINLILKLIFARARPEVLDGLVVETGYSFPSGHSMIAAALALSVIILCWRTRWRWGAVAVSAAYFMLVGASRVYLGVHYPSDVLAGWCVSLLWVFVAYKAIGRLSPRKTTG